MCLCRPTSGLTFVSSGSGCSPPGPGARNENIFPEENLCPAFFGKIMGGQHSSGFAVFYCLQLTKTSNAKVAYFEVAYPDPLHMIKTAECIQFLAVSFPLISNVLLYSLYNYHF